MLNLKCIKSLGIELEMFATKRINEKQIVYNATEEVKNIFGFSINPNFTTNFLHLNNLKIVTDGTVFEFQKLFIDYYDINLNVDIFRRDLESLFKNSFLNKYHMSPIAFFKNGRYIVFDSSNNVYSSGKMMYNAYTGTHRYEEKKEGDKLVDFRTTGLHLHFEFTNPVEDLNTNNIVKTLDKIYEDYFPNDISPVMQEREKYIIRGDYRLKYQSNGITTLEYRRLAPGFLFDKNKLETFLYLADAELNKIIKVNEN